MAGSASQPELWLDPKQKSALGRTEKLEMRQFIDRAWKELVMLEADQRHSVRLVQNVSSSPADNTNQIQSKSRNIATSIKSGTKTQRNDIDRSSTARGESKVHLNRIRIKKE